MISSSIRTVILRRLISTVFAFSIVWSAQADGQPGYRIPDTEVHKIISELIGEDYEILVWLPYTYDKVETNTYPVLYILDGQWDFASVQTSIRNNFADRRIPEMILVGISFGGSKPEHLNKRSHACLPTRRVMPNGSVRGGGAPQFLQFIKEGIIPLIESNYRVDYSSRALGGASYGGLFALYTMMMEPELFDSYIVLSPSLRWDKGWFLAEQKRHAKTYQSMKARMWLGVGGNEPPKLHQGVDDFLEELNAQRSEDFLVKYHKVDDEGHAGMKVESYHRALRYIFGHLKK